MNILVVSAHPDDEIIGMGGTLKKLSQYHDVKILFLADGITARKKSGHVNSSEYEVTDIELKKMNKEIEERKKHAKIALAMLGVKKMKFLDLPDNELDVVPFLKIVKEVEKEIVLTKPNVIFTHHFNDLNIDHRLAYEATITAARPIFNSTVESIISFEAISSTDWKKPYKFNPNMCVDISLELKTKLKSISAYKNEIRKYPHPRSKETIEAVAKRWGSLYGFKAGEAFEIIMTRMMDVKNLSLGS
ncbi:MAG: PIG-L family deacetylase [Patescibacteria group bacterium]|nr:PIG-L family deacetylase [Patescibacteria group bacterium]